MRWPWRRRRPLVLYVATGLTGNHFYAPHYRSCAYYRLLCRVTDVLATLDADVVVKLHTAAEHQYNPLPERLRGSGIRVVSSGLLVQWLRRASLVVLDNGGTPLLEALAADVPVLLYEPAHWAMSPEALAWLRERATVVTTEPAFLDALRLFADLPRV